MPIPQHLPTPRELDDLELLLNGALAPRTGFDPVGPVTLALPDGVADAARQAGAVELTDAEGTPLARVAADGTVTALAPQDARPFRRLYRAPTEVRTESSGGPAYVVRGAPTADDLALLDGPATLLVLCGHGTPVGLSPVGLLRVCVTAVRDRDDISVVAVPLADHGDAAVDEELAVRVAGAYADDVRALPGTGPLTDEVAAAVALDRPPRDEQGLVVLFTGLSGSGKSTLARALHDLVVEDGRRTVTSLDGDVVRRHLSAGLGFSREDRETNIRRIGWVAAEIARHRGLAICSPIAPFAQTRADVRGYVEDAGGAYFCVHVATPLEECERRDRKGLYAKARAGEIPDFTGISSPYEEPVDADVRVDTTGRSVEDALGDVLDGLASAGLLDLRPHPEES
ncbi:hypothetical protein GCM10011519_16730 [Marmoricola endophyticus]|uniref:Adenylyl-sulfate kinase n=1 Tax=Marmoricola endophyticus TaxID=2040280 RepID=A0A917BHV0_9ACTN|nr:adenylyl-sulfate kinase [Marmoricola endophyticus]GGF43498.1 hypothetical protein GCM10011519_16730 [Marmoricola endophyticus]